MSEQFEQDDREGYIPGDLYNRLQEHLLRSGSREALLLMGELIELTGASELRRRERESARRSPAPQQVSTVEDDWNDCRLRLGTSGPSDLVAIARRYFEEGHSYGRESVLYRPEGGDQ